ncbi:MAG: HAD-IC family P-type ATPase [Candidatus Borkfalkiaceae bacterium]|nr:HAD-IC family P-type ATPase [Clostridia bacterium]MDY6223898.1 HAD-IC family P-type ATPase [Christensenellaceae bacterium]
MNETKKTPEKRRAASIRENAAATTAGTEKEASGKQEVSVPALREPAEKNKAEKNKSEEKRKNKKNKIKEETEIIRFFPDRTRGLTDQQVASRLEQGLNNSAPKKYSKSYGSIFFGNICTFFNFLCVVAAAALIVANAPVSQFTFVLIFFCNIVVAIVQEIRAKLKIDRLSILSAPTAKVLREGKKKDVPVSQIVLDDIVFLSAGQQIPADCIMLDGAGDVNEALLTGESVPIKKSEGDSLLAGSFVTGGHLTARVDKIGTDTYINRLTARAKKYKRPNSEIINSIYLFIKLIGIMIVPVAIFMFFTNLKAEGILWADIEARGGFFNILFSSNTFDSVIQKTFSVVIGMIPSGLLLLTTVALSVGMIRLAKYNTLVQDMYSLEMLARVNVLCLDKTGTITDGRMRVSDCVLLNNPTEYTVDDILGSMLASLDDNNQTSIALYDRFGHSSALQSTAQIPFSSVRKLSAVSFGDLGTFAMGAPEFVLRPMPARVEKLVKQYAQMGLRVLVLAHSPQQIMGDKLPVIFRPVAIITLSDNIRPDAIDTIRWFKENDVAVKVISGDNPVTVSEVARRAGIINASKFISLEGLSPLEVENAANEYTVFGRVTPEQKAILIRSIKKAGNTVAMTGDGVNDILAMKEADCAVSVASGSEAARNVSNLVLQDNNFSSMPKIVNEGRRVINNIKNSASLYIMKTLLTLILAVVCIATGSRYFFTTNNMILYEVLISAVPSFVLSLQPNTSRVKGKFIPFVISRALPGALTMALGIVALYMLNMSSLSYIFSYASPSGETLSLYEPMLILSLTFTGLVMLLRICQPLNLIRSVLFAFCAAACVTVLAIPMLGEFIYEGWSGIDFNVTQILLIVVIVQAAMPVSSGLIKFFDMFNPAEDDPAPPARYSSTAAAGNAAVRYGESGAAENALKQEDPPRKKTSAWKKIFTGKK